jgi:hypothetical protein
MGIVEYALPTRVNQQRAPGVRAWAGIPLDLELNKSAAPAECANPAIANRNPPGHTPATPSTIELPIASSPARPPSQFG